MNRLDALHRVARHVAWHPLRDFVVLRGGLVLRRQILPIPRPIEDVDFLIRVDSFDAFRTVVAALFPTSALELTWAELEHPGLRTHVIVGHHEIRIDFGFGDTMLLPTQRYVMGELELDTVAAEQHFAWKFHGLFERGRGRWRPKDLMDLIGLKRFGRLDRSLLAGPIRAAFLDHDDDLGEIDRLASGEFGMSRGSRRRWRRFVEARTDRYGDASLVPPSHLPLLAELAGYVVPLLSGKTGNRASRPTSR